MPVNGKGKSRSTKRLRHKSSVFELLNPNAKREFRMINKAHLKIPIELYQRNEADGKIAREIAMHFDMVAFGCLTVIVRENGDLHIADGGTRWNAAMERPDVDELPCLAFSGISDKEASDTFLRINLNRRRLSTAQQQHGELFAGHNLAIRADAAEQLLAQAQISFGSLSALRACLKSAPKAADNIVSLLPEFAAGQHITSRVFKASVKLEELLNKSNLTLRSAKNLKKLRKEFPGLDRTLLAVLPPQGQSINRSLLNAQVMARSLRIRLPIGAGK